MFEFPDIPSWPLYQCVTLNTDIAKKNSKIPQPEANKSCNSSAYDLCVYFLARLVFFSIPLIGYTFARTLTLVN